MPQYLDFLDQTNKYVRVSASIAGPTSVSGTITVLPHAVWITGPAAVSGTLSIGNTPDVKQTGGPWAVSGTVTAQSTLQAGTSNAGNVGGITNVIDATLTRPGNTTAYTAGDEMTDTGAAILTLTNLATKSGGTGVITAVEISVSSNAATKPDLTLFFYDTTSTPATDNGAFAPSDGVQDTYLGKTRITDFEVGDATSNTGNFVMSSGQIHIPYKCVGSANAYLRVKVNNGYQAGANSDTYKFRVKALQDL